MVDGIIKGKHAFNYDKYSYSPNKKNQYNSFLNRNILKNKTIADFCCGTGISIEFLKHRAKKIYGIDASPEMIEICKKRFYNNSNADNINNKKIVLLHENVNHTSLNPSSCDYVIIRMGLHHIKDKLPVIEEAWRVLKKKGRLLIIDKFLIYPTIITLPYDIARNFRRGDSLFGHYYIRINSFKKLIKEKFNLIDEFSHKKQIFLKSNLVLEKILM